MGGLQKALIFDKKTNICEKDSLSFMFSIRDKPWTIEEKTQRKGVKHAKIGAKDA